MEDTLAQNQDCESFNQQIASCQEKVRASVQQKYKFNSYDLDDVMQKATIKAWRSLSKFRNDSSFSTWYYRIARNEAFDFMKVKNNRNHHEVDVEIKNGDETYSVLEKLVDKQLEETACSILERKEQIVEYQKMIKYALNNMSDTHRTILQLSFDEKSYKDMGEILQLPVGTIMSRLHSARQSARQLIKDYSKNHNVSLPF